MLLKTLTMAALAALSFAAPALAGDVVVTLTGVEARGGVMLASLQTRGEFMQAASAHAQSVERPAAGVLRLTFRDVAPGDYALMVLHDEDGDHRMKMNGYMPGEGWAMVNGANLMGPPTFDLVKFAVAASGAEISVPMAYPR